MPCLPLTRSTILLAILSVLALSACQQAAPDGSTPEATEPATNQTDSPDPLDETAEAADERSIIDDVEFGSGPFSLDDPSAGLANLSSYRATLTLAFEGTTDGQPDQWSRTYVMLADNALSARQMTIEMAGDTPQQVFMADINGAHYELQGDGSCVASVIEEERSLAAWWEPVTFLNPVIGADEAGSETINSVPAEHYTFDEAALGQTDLTSSAGEVWVASDGGYVVKYLLTTEAGEDYFGEGGEGTLSWSYDLTEANSPIAIDLPADCPAGMIDAPLLPDASDVLNVPGLIRYGTTTSLADAAAFYQEELPALGWQASGTPSITETQALLSFIQGDQKLTLIITLDDAGTTVRMVIVPNTP